MSLLLLLLINTKVQSHVKRYIYNYDKHESIESSVYIQLVFGFFILEIYSKMHFVENSTFGKILKLFIRSDYAERNCV